MNDRNAESSPVDLDADEVCRRGKDLYERHVRAAVESHGRGRFVVIDVLTGDYEIGDDDLEASDKAMLKNPNAVLYGTRIGYPSAYRLGRSSSAQRP